jgi:hypothetical protein
VLDRARQGHPKSVFSCVKMFFVCDVIGGEAKTSIETSEVGWFAQDALPQDLSVSRVLPSQLRRVFEHAQQPELATDFE